MRPLLLAAVTMSGLLSGCSSSQSVCTELGCQSGAHFQTGVRFNGSSDTLTVDVCKNNACARGTAQGLSPTTGAPACFVSGAIDATCSVTQASAGNAILAIDIPGAGANAEGLNDGDTYRIVVTRAQTNETVIDTARTVTYKSVQPNGPACPPKCKQADLS